MSSAAVCMRLMASPTQRPDGSTALAIISWWTSSSSIIQANQWPRPDARPEICRAGHLKPRLRPVEVAVSHGNRDLRRGNGPLVCFSRRKTPAFSLGLPRPYDDGSGSGWGFGGVVVLGLLEIPPQAGRYDPARRHIISLKRATRRSTAWAPAWPGATPPLRLGKA
ncbi:hypothetical protein B0I37DRAFT_7274 [Chaetomium sp. MPI-CAGE-AT-0009]|nr:hypothetical protein B0I37DRAFT_7274 [Chaetomium sp. MPI-CAGE-AT-0009]